MADDFDVESMLEAPYKKEEDKRVGREKGEVRSADKDRDRRKRSRSHERRRSKERDGGHSKHREKHSGGVEKIREEKSRSEKKRSRSRERVSKRSRSRERFGSGGGGGHFPRGGRGGRFGGFRDDFKRRSISKSPLRGGGAEADLTPEERDARTVLCMQLAARIRTKDLDEFFSAVGKIRDVRLITDNKTKRSKGIAYVEFVDVDSVPLAIGLAGQKLLGVPIIVQPSQAERNRLAMAASGNVTQTRPNTGPMRLYIGSLHFNITEEMLKSIFEPFGKLAELKLMKDHDTGRSRGYGFAMYHNAEDAKRAMDQLNGFELAGRPMRVGTVTEKSGNDYQGNQFDRDEQDRAGFDLGATGRLQLMAKLAEGTGFQIPQVAANALSLTAAAAAAQQQTPSVFTQCFMLSNMFNPATETSATWFNEIRDDVLEECNKHGGALHIYVDKASPQGNVYVKCPSISAAVASVNALHGRYFSGQIITAAYVPLPNYHQLFPDAIYTSQLLTSSNSGEAGQALSAPPPFQGMTSFMQ